MFKYLDHFCVVTCAPWLSASISSELTCLLYAILMGISIFSNIFLPNKTCQSYSWAALSNIISCDPTYGLSCSEFCISENKGFLQLTPNANLANLMVKSMILKFLFVIGWSLASDDVSTCLTKVASPGLINQRQTDFQFTDRWIQCLFRFVSDVERFFKIEFFKMGVYWNVWELI